MEFYLSMTDLIDFFLKTEMFADVSLSDLEFLNQFCSVVSLKRGAIILRPGEIVKNIYLIKQGLVKIDILSINNTTERLPDEKVGDLIGEMELWDNHPIIAMCTAKTDVVLIKIDKNDFKKFLNRSTIVREKIYSGTIKKWRNLEIIFHKNIELLAEAIQKINKDEELLHQQQKQIQEESRLKEIFIENISHELRTPLTVIRGVSESFDVENENKVSLEYNLYLKFKNSSSYLLDLINELLDFSQLSKGDIKLNYLWDDPSKGLKEVLDNLFNSKIPRHKIDISYSLPDPILIYIDMRRVKQILYHLVSNAIKYTEKGSVSINIYLKDLKKSTCMFCIDVKDTGIGMNEDDKKIIFNKFVRLKNKFYTQMRGTGLGLSLVKTIIDLMKGTITVESTLNIGSEFKIEIPTTCKEIEKVDITKFDQKIKEIDLEHSLRILLIDDYEDTHIIVKNLLKKYKFKIDSLFDWRTVVKTVEKNDYDIILLDIMLPEVDGYKILELLKDFYKGKEKIKTIPKIIAFTALSSEKELEKINQSGFDDKLLKPFSKEDLVKKLLSKS